MTKTPDTHTHIWQMFPGDPWVPQFGKPRSAVCAGCLLVRRTARGIRNGKTRDISRLLVKPTALDYPRTAVDAFLASADRESYEG